MIAYVCIWLNGLIPTGNTGCHTFSNIARTYSYLQRKTHGRARIFTCGSVEFGKQCRVFTPNWKHVEIDQLLTDDRISCFVREMMTSSNTYYAMIADVLRFRLMYYVLENHRVDGVLYLDTDNYLRSVSFDVKPGCVALSDLHTTNNDVIYANGLESLRMVIDAQNARFESIRMANPSVLKSRMSSYMFYSDLFYKYYAGVDVADDEPIEYPHGTSLCMIIEDYRVHSKITSTVSPLADIILTTTLYYLGPKWLWHFTQTHANIFDTLDVKFAEVGEVRELRTVNDVVLFEKYQHILLCLRKAFADDPTKLRDFDHDEVIIAAIMC